MSPVGIQPEQGYSIMPSSVRLSENRIVTAVRLSETRIGSDTAHCWIDLYQSDNNGRTWSFLSRPAEQTGRGGNPPAMIRLRDGRLCLAYAHRAAPFRLCARLSEDEGRTWSGEIVLRDDGGNHDIGYPRIAERSDGSVVIVYYFNDEPQGERYIAATIWKP